MLEKNGLVKLAEECGELVQIACKKMTCMDSDVHYDGEIISTRLEDEIADVMAVSEVVIKNFGLDRARIIKRSNEKFQLFERWMAE